MNTPSSKPRLAAWIGPALAVFGLLSYFMLFARWPSLRDTAALNLLLVALGAAASLWASWRILRNSSSLLGKLGTLVGTGLSLSSATLLVLYVFVVSNQLPSPATASRTQAVAPDFALQDHEGATLRLSDFKGQKVLVVFYRGYW